MFWPWNHRGVCNFFSCVASAFAKSADTKLVPLHHGQMAMKESHYRLHYYWTKSRDITGLDLDNLSDIDYIISITREKWVSFLAFHLTLNNLLFVLVFAFSYQSAGYAQVWYLETPNFNQVCLLVFLSMEFDWNSRNCYRYQHRK